MSKGDSSIEVELKFAVAEHQPLVAKLLDRNAQLLGVEQHRDTYFRHPCRDFAQTKEALRIRRMEVRETGSTSCHIESRITYKGPKLPGVVKARQELEWDVQPVDSNADYFEQLLQSLGFQSVLTVIKQRQSYAVLCQGQRIVVALDTVEGLGNFVEIEVVVDDAAQVESAREIVQSLATQLELHEPESRSYLTLRLQE